MIASPNACEFTTFKLQNWKCIQEGAHQAYQIPSPCARNNPNVPSTFEIHNRSDGHTWRLEVFPKRSFRTYKGKKIQVYRFELDTFFCSSTNDYQASILVEPVNAHTPFEFLSKTTCGLLLVCFLLCCCLYGDSRESESAVRHAIVAALWSDDDEQVKFD